MGLAPGLRTFLSTCNIPEHATATIPCLRAFIEHTAAFRKTLMTLDEATPDQVAQRFIRGRKASVLPFLQGLAGVGLARTLEDGRFATRSA